MKVRNKITQRQTGQLKATSALLSLALLASACGSSSSPSSTKSISASAKQTLVFAAGGLGTEGTATKTAIAGFEKLHPNITVKLLSLSSSSSSAKQQLTQGFIAGSSTPDVFYTDVIWPPAFAKAGWLMPLNKFHPKSSSFFPGEVKAGQYNGKTYAVPWFINAEGVYYRKDLIPTPPSTPSQLVADAKMAMAKDKSITTGLAFEGAKYEGSVTAFVNFLGGFGGSLNPSNLNTPANKKALTFMHNAIYSYHISPQAVTGWQEPNVQNAFLNGSAAFAMNWPYLYSLAEKPGSAVAGKTGWIPFPSATGTPQAALGGDMLAINAKSQHSAAAWEFIQYLQSPAVQTQRAISAGDPPALISTYNSSLYAKAPYYKQEKSVFKYATPRPITPAYPQISSDLQTMISATLSNQGTPGSLLKTAASQIKAIKGVKSIKG